MFHFMKTSIALLVVVSAASCTTELEDNASEVIRIDDSKLEVRSLHKDTPIEQQETIYYIRKMPLLESVNSKTNNFK